MTIFFLTKKLALSELKGGADMNVRHIMKDGTVRQSVEGLKITSKEFYVIFNEIRSKKNESNSRCFGSLIKRD